VGGRGFGAELFLQGLDLVERFGAIARIGLFLRVALVHRERLLVLRQALVAARDVVGEGGGRREIVGLAELAEGLEVLAFLVERLRLLVVLGGLFLVRRDGAGRRGGRRLRDGRGGRGGLRLRESRGGRGEY